MNQISAYPVHSTSVANFLLDLATGSGKQLDQMQLQKLVYFSHGWYLAIYDSDLTSDEPEAWNYGPLYNELWVETRIYGNQPVTEKINFNGVAIQPAINCLHITQSELIRKVFEIYRDYSGISLSMMTHREGTPWYETFVRQGKSKSIIPRNLIKNHFTQLLQTRNSSNG